VPTATSAERPTGRPRVRFLAHGAERSGPPVALLRWLRAWRIDDPGFDTEVVIGRTGPLAPEYAALSELRTAGLDRRSPEQLVARGFDAVGLAHLGRRVRAAATRVRVGDRPADLVVVNGATAAGVELLRTTPQAPTVLIAHELSTGWMSNIDADDRGLLLSSSQGFLAVSHAVEDFLVEQLGVAQEIITVVPPPVDVEGVSPSRRYQSSLANRCTVVSGGFTDWRKAPDMFIALADRCVKQAPEIDWRFEWFGGDNLDDPAAWPLRFEINRLGLGERVVFLGHLKDPGPILARADIFVSTAREDAAPLVAAEAAGSGLPVVAFDSGGVRELVSQGPCGIIVEEFSALAMARAIVALATDRSRREQLGSTGAYVVRKNRSAAHIAERVGSWIHDQLSATAGSEST